MWVVEHRRTDRFQCAANVIWHKQNRKQNAVFATQALSVRYCWIYGVEKTYSE